MRPLKRALLAALNACDRRGAPEGGLPPSSWGLERDAGGGLVWDGCALEALGRQFGTPLHVVSRARLELGFRRFRDAFAARYPGVEVAYSYKTNPLPGVIRSLHEFGAAAEVISHFELWLALKLGVPPARIIFNGPAKTPAAIDLAVREGVKLINIDGAAEIPLIEESAARHGRRQRVGVRIVTSVGWSSQFGFRLADGSAAAAFRALRACGHVEPCALHVHLGTGLHDAAIYLKAVGEAVDFARRLRSGTGVAIAHFDLGGGFNVPTVRELSGMDQRFLAHGFPVRPPRAGETPTPAEFAAGIVERIRQAASGADVAPEIILEPGRALTSAAQCLLLTVLALKPGDRHGRHAIVDGGRNLSMPLGYEYHELLAAREPRGAPRERYTVFGPLCHPHDVVARHRRLPPLAVGDMLAVMDAGAYFIPNQMNFSNPRAAAVMITDEGPRLIRARESFEDLVRLDVP